MTPCVCFLSRHKEVAVISELPPKPLMDYVNATAFVENMKEQAAIACPDWIISSVNSFRFGHLVKRIGDITAEYWINKHKHFKGELRCYFLGCAGRLTWSLFILMRKWRSNTVGNPVTQLRTSIYCMQIGRKQSNRLIDENCDFPSSMCMRLTWFPPASLS